MEKPLAEKRKFYAIALDMLVLNPNNPDHIKPMKKKFSVKQKLFIFLLDMIVLAELAGCICWAHQFNDSMTPMFLKAYLPIVLVTLIVGKYCLNRIGTPQDI